MALGENITAWRMKKGWTTHQLANEAGIKSQSSISRYESNKIRPRKESLKKIAHALGAQVVQLEYGTADFDIVPMGKSRIPVLAYNAVAGWLNGMDSNLTKAENQFVLTDSIYSDRAFMLVVKGESMLPEFRPGDRIIIDPEVKPKPGDFVIAFDKSDPKKDAVFMRMKQVGKIVELHPLDEWKQTFWSSADMDFQIVGKMVDSARSY